MQSSWHRRAVKAVDGGGDVLGRPPKGRQPLAIFAIDLGITCRGVSLALCDVSFLHILQVVDDLVAVHLLPRLHWHGLRATDVTELLQSRGQSRPDLKDRFSLCIANETNGGMASFCSPSLSCGDAGTCSPSLQRPVR